MQMSTGVPLALRLARRWMRVQAGYGPRQPAARALELQRICRMVSRLHGLDVRLEGAPPAPGVVLVSNHLGYLDPLVLCSLCACSPIAKYEMSKWAMIGPLTQQLNVLFVRRDCVQSRAVTLLRAFRALRRGITVLNFPEGTTARAGLLPFHRGAFWLAHRAGRPLVPIVMQFDDPQLCWVDQENLLPHYLRLLGNPRRTLRVRFLSPLQPDAYPTPTALARACRERMRSALQSGLG